MDDHEEVRDYLRLFFEQLELTHVFDQPESGILWLQVTGLLLYLHTFSQDTCTFRSWYHWHRNFFLCSFYGVQSTK